MRHAVFITIANIEKTKLKSISTKIWVSETNSVVKENYSLLLFSIEKNCRYYKTIGCYRKRIRIILDENF